MGQAQQPPITVIEPENLETVFITGGLIEAIDTQTVRIVGWVDRPATNSRKGERAPDASMIRSAAGRTRPRTSTGALLPPA